MECKRCDYRLWNLKSRQCPECGTPFHVSDYEFVPNSVQFCCPDCGQAYYGTGPKGHLVPPRFACIQCGRSLHMDDMVLLPTEGLEEEQTQTFRPAWLDRKKRGVVRSWFSMVGVALTSPGRLIRATPVDSSLPAAFWFAVFTQFLISVGMLLPFFIVPAVMLLATGSGPGGRLFAIAPVGAIMAAGALAIVPLLGLWGLLAHGLLRLTGPTFAGPRRTCQALCYSSGANALTGIPCLGYYVGWIWWLVSAVVMVKEGQRVRGPRAAFAVLTGPLLSIAGLIGLYVWFMISVMGAAPGAVPGRSGRTIAPTSAPTATVISNQSR